MKVLPDLTRASARDAAQFILEYIRQEIPWSSTRLSLQVDGYPEDGEVEITIRNYRSPTFSAAKKAMKALKTGCGNCQEMAYASAIILRTAGYPGTVSIGQYGINHQFLFIEDLIVDPWAEMICSVSDWRGKLFAYGGSIKEGILHGRLLPWNHDDMEDETPEVVETIPMSYHSLTESISDIIIEDTTTSSNSLPLRLFLLGNPQEQRKKLSHEIVFVRTLGLSS
ncbi:transglutaminase domain-containing protein [Legionella oakridgensis]|uniref:Transglutaminase-like superfamily n=2 Tax=Legionella oakridgensis TaxID=29423 RepID=W0B9V4_9GAMM|nr:transglutaminase domain-containing protein [Legionella oakridgensis]AHE67298.1 transglutaminase-like superfamily [Legionella oakridgensis ATCC 33761 = DSM 21215]ETO93050.1 transglutaminase-like superfamily [Legionella oakridgensis RV-2-2007]KTD37914.1 hypothetical protein Loak_1590 [Legionella oakridgensis]STY20364.1 Uncharacterised protein [Legionella longbeachae]